MKCMFSKGAGSSLMPFDADAEEFIRKLKMGDGVWVEVKKARNYRFHKKMFALLNLAFDAWEPEGREYKGQQALKNFDRFREDVTILAGHFESTFRIDGEVRLRAKSISFASMDDFEFEKVYRDVLTVVWNRILRNARYASMEEVEQVVNRLMAFE